MGEVEHPYLLADQARHPVIRETASTHNKYNNYPYFRLMSGGGRGIPFMLEAPEVRPSDSRQAGCTHPQSDRMNMTTQDPKKQNL